MGPLVVSPLMPASVEKIIVYARKLHLQHNFNWPEKLPKYLTKKRFIHKAIYFSESTSVPKLALVNCKGQPPPSNAISMAAKGVAGLRGWGWESPGSRIRMPVLQVGRTIKGVSLNSVNLGLSSIGWGLTAFAECT